MKDSAQVHPWALCYVNSFSLRMSHRIWFYLDSNLFL